MKEKIEEILTRGVAEVIDRDHLRARLLSTDVLRIKFGIDPTSPNIHLGRSVALLKLRDLQRLGHQIIFLIGDATGVIGDTSDKESERPMLTKAVVAENMRAYVAQAGKIIDMGKVEIVHNSVWLNELGYDEIGAHADQFSLAEFIARDNIKRRLEEGKRVSLREVLYPLMQGYDSIAVRADVEIGGTDQRFNILAGRTLQKYAGQEPQDILTVNLIAGTDGRKMSSSWGNTINLTDASNDMFGKVMSIGDGLIETYFVHCTRVPMGEIKKFLSGAARDAKLRLAKEIVALYHGAREAEAAETYFVETFSKRIVPKDIIATVVAGEEIPLVDFLVLTGQAKSKGDARRKITQGGVEVDGARMQDAAVVLSKEKNQGSSLKVGKHGFAKISFV